jgi:hypothetical protein
MVIDIYNVLNSVSHVIRDKEIVIKIIGLCIPNLKPYFFVYLLCQVWLGLEKDIIITNMKTGAI